MAWQHRAVGQSEVAAEGAAASSRKPRQAHKPYIDCIRGYAVLMVITCHLAYVFPNLPYPLHRVAVTGWFGVQLFFLASCVTLLQSWASERQRVGRVSIGAFFTRRFLRIAPAYYLAAILYGLVHPSQGGRNVWQVLTSVTFVNALWPSWALETKSIVPGGWSIGCEFAFYAVFPVFARYVTSLRRAWLAVALALAFGLAANQLALAWSLRLPDMTAIGLFRWFPNEGSVFALGAVAYFLIEDKAAPWQRWVRRYATAIVLAAAAAFFAAAYAPLGDYIGAAPPLPATLYVSVVFVVAIVGLSTGPAFLVNRLVAWVGTISFSAYLLHFAVLDVLGAIPDVTHAQANGVAAIAAFAACWPVTLLCTAALSWVSYTVIETPMIEWGRSIVRARRLAALAG